MTVMFITLREFTETQFVIADVIINTYSISNASTTKKQPSIS